MGSVTPDRVILYRDNAPGTFEDLFSLVPLKKKSQYAHYMDKAQPELDLNRIEKNVPISVFPKKLYTGYSVRNPPYMSSVPRDSKQKYIYPGERSEHPETFSRFGRDYYANGYGEGIRIGSYKYYDDIEPSNMAPPNLYGNLVPLGGF